MKYSKIVCGLVACIMIVPLWAGEETPQMEEGPSLVGIDAPAAPAIEQGVKITDPAGIALANLATGLKAITGNVRTRRASEPAGSGFAAELQSRIAARRGSDPIGASQGAKKTEEILASQQGDNKINANIRILNKWLAESEPIFQRILYDTEAKTNYAVSEMHKRIQSIKVRTVAWNKEALKKISTIILKNLTGYVDEAKKDFAYAVGCLNFIEKMKSIYVDLSNNAELTAYKLNFKASLQDIFFGSDGNKNESAIIISRIEVLPRTKIVLIDLKSAAEKLKKEAEDFLNAILQYLKGLKPENRGLLDEVEALQTSIIIVK